MNNKRTVENYFWEEEKGRRQYLFCKFSFSRTFRLRFWHIMITAYGDVSFIPLKIYYSNCGLHSKFMILYCSTAAD